MTTSQMNLFDSFEHRLNVGADADKAEWGKLMGGAKVKRTIPTMDLTRFHLILISTSAGKDSQAMLSAVHRMAVEQGVTDRLIAVHADLGRAEWTGTDDLAQQQCDMLNIPLTTVRSINKRGDEHSLLERVAERGMWYGIGTTQWCTSDFKRGPINKVITAHNKAFRQTNPGETFAVLNCIGYRSLESDKRKAKVRDDGMLTGQINERLTNKTRTTTDWSPIGEWTEEQVWAEIDSSGLPHHFAYDLGMPRLSCVFCIYANRSQLLLAGRHNPELLAEYVQIETQIDHTFTQKQSLAEIQTALAAGEEPNMTELADGKGGAM